MIPAIETADHDGNLPPLHVGDVGHLTRVLLDGRRWVLTSPGDPIAEHLLDDAAAEGTSHDPG